MKITNKKRFITAITIILVIFLAMSCFAKEGKEIITEDYTVSAGDTLWSIASENCPSNMDIREYIYNIRQLNNIEDCIIHPGEVIQIIK